MKDSVVIRTLKVLLIDDNPADRLLTSRILRREFSRTSSTVSDKAI